MICVNYRPQEYTAIRAAYLPNRLKRFEARMGSRYILLSLGYRSPEEYEQQEGGS